MPEIGLDQLATEIGRKQGYTVLQAIGAGSYKVTFLAEDQSGAKFALKLFKSGSPTQRSEREIEAMRRCDHPNIGTLESVQVVPYSGVPYLVLIEEYLGGGTLTARVEQQRLTGAELAHLARELVPAIAHIASLDLVHRDLKPDNIMFRDDGRTPVIVDFGIVRDLNDTSLTQTFLHMGPGTPRYAAPEQLLNEKAIIDWRTDQFSLGVVLCECLTGKHPYERIEDSPLDVVQRVADRQQPSVEFVSDIQNVGLEVLNRMIQPWPANRFRTPEMLMSEWSKVLT